MEIKRSSWHYKISNLGILEKSNDNLCCYFWRLMGKFFVFFVAAVFIGFIIGFLIWEIFLTGFVISNTIMLFFLFSIFILPILAIHFLRKKIDTSLEMPYGNIVAAYLSAKKEKICPLIKYI